MRLAFRLFNAPNQAKGQDSFSFMLEQNMKAPNHPSSGTRQSSPRQQSGLNRQQHGSYARTLGQVNYLRIYGVACRLHRRRLCDTGADWRVRVAMGFLGASSQLLSVSPRFRRLNFLQRGFLNWVSAYLPLVAIAALLVNLKLAESNPDFWPEMAKLLLLYIGTPMLCLTLFVSLITSTRNGRHRT